MEQHGNHLFFYSGKDFLSNFHFTDILYHGHLFKSSEQLFMYHKAHAFGDEEVQEAILDSKLPIEAKKLGKVVQNLDPDVWEPLSIEVMLKTLRSKFYQNDHLSKKLLETEDLILVEASPMDRKWGIGFNTQDAILDQNRKRWGQNLLGKCLMTVRHEFKRGPASVW